MDHEFRQRRIQELQKQQREQEELAHIETVVKQHLSKDALTRFGTLKTVYPEKAMTVMAALVQLIQKGQLTSEVTDAQLKAILQRLEPARKDITITRK